MSLITPEMLAVYEKDFADFDVNGNGVLEVPHRSLLLSNGLTRCLYLTVCMPVSAGMLLCLCLAVSVFGYMYLLAFHSVSLSLSVSSTGNHRCLYLTLRAHQQPLSHCPWLSSGR